MIIKHFNCVLMIRTCDLHTNEELKKKRRQNNAAFFYGETVTYGITLFCFSFICKFTIQIVQFPYYQR
ncbi:hypothetical protein EZS27_035558 [termite gut metagenome]|uniref:Uncharacterized protein n=1 Tax=termite gut metagenome TaxID=433724 RepID=A0A5J4PY09_9ZZZZ